jgi:2-polyprenyl-3-methyl-5-hydroxy-6-metoxy-1,4-benzoquinol methylase
VFQKHSVEWTEDKIINFWKNYKADYFSEETGKAIIDLALKYGLGGKVLDYGSGRGELVLLLNERGLSATGYEPATGELLAAGQFDFIFLIEVLEHVLKPTELLERLYDLLSPGGKLFITIPNSENLEKHKVLCPDCGALFHRMQHLQSFTAKSLRNLVEIYRFKTEKIIATNLLDWTATGKLKRLVRKLFGRQFNPNLILIAKK